MNGANFEVKNIMNVTGVFEIPSYQRGYRWDDEVIQLLDDLSEINTSDTYHYCLQPIVVKKIGDECYTLIDGQQRLTTLFLILKAIHKSVPTINAKYIIDYKVRTRCTDFLDTISESSDESNIDFYYIKKAYLSILKWFSKKDFSDIYQLVVLLERRVDIIWYEVGSSENEIELFRNLNSGKIPLTSSELVKAMFLSETTGHVLSNDKKSEIAHQWDYIEKELRDDSFWYFLTNEDYRPRIDFILDLNSGCSKSDKDKYATFHYYDNIRKNHLKNLTDIWDDIQHTFLILKDWYKNHELYHLIGFLTKADVDMREVYQLSLNKTKKDFVVALKDKIKEVMKLPNNKNYGDLSYTNKSDWTRMTRLLLLFNVISINNHGEKSERFSFEKYKNGKWSLEHIHAQQSQGLETVEAWKEWLKFQLPSVKQLSDDTNLISEIEQKIAGDSSLTNNIFNNLRLRVESILSEDPNLGCIHTIHNMALLTRDNNAALNNSTFDVKRNVIIDLDQKGQFIPYCTKMVFLKYYSPSQTTQLHFWGAEDRKNYVRNINSTLSEYLQEPIPEEQEITTEE